MNIHWKPTNIIRARILGGDKAQQFLTNELHRRMDKYVPCDNGGLRVNTEVGLNYVTYKSPYAHYVYKGELYVDPETGSSYASAGTTKVPTGIPLNYHTPGTGSYWDKKAWTAEKDEIIKATQEYIKRGSK